MSLALLVLSVFFINTVYHFGQSITAVLLRVHHKHYFFGFLPRLFDLTIFDVRISLGIYIPMIGLSKVYRVENGEKFPAYYPWQFFGEPIWKRFVATIGGIISLIIAGILTFITIAYVEPESYITKAEVNKYGIYPSVLAAENGFEKGDRILSINGMEYERYDELIDPELYLTEGNYYTVLRAGNKIDIKIKKTIPSNTDTHRPFLSLLVPFEIERVLPESAASVAGLLPGDRITKVNGRSIIKIYEFQDEVINDSNGSVNLVVQRQVADSIQIFETSINKDGSNKLGLLFHESFSYTSKRDSLIESIVKGTYRSFATLNAQIKGFVGVLNGKIYARKSYSGPIGITEAFGASFNWIRFWILTGVLVMFIAFCNILPLPKSAFWQIIPLAYEGLTGKQYSMALADKMKKLGYVIVILLFAWIIGGDIIRLLL